MASASANPAVSPKPASSPASGIPYTVTLPPCRSGGTGRRARLKIEWRQLLVGSIPTSGTSDDGGVRHPASGIARLTAAGDTVTAVTHRLFSWSSAPPSWASAETKRSTACSLDIMNAGMPVRWRDVRW
jgi:hypothetical protein